MKKTSIFLLLIMIGLYSCVYTKKRDSEKKLSIDLTNNEQVKLSNFFCDSVEYIKLESPEEHLIGAVSRLEITKQYIIIGDGNNTQSIFIFSRDGKFLSEISALGNGPFEYNVLHDFFFDESKQEIGVFSNGKLIFYDINGNGLRSQFITFGTMYDFMGNFIFVSGVDSDHYLHVLSKDGYKEMKFIPRGENRMSLDYRPYTNFSGRKDSLLFLPSLGQTFYCYTDGKVFKKYDVNFGKNNIPIEILNSIQDFFEFVSICGKNNYAYNIDRFFESNVWLHFSFVYNHKFYYTFYNRVTKEITTASDFTNDLNRLKFNRLIGNTDNGIIQSSWPLDIKEELEELKSKMSLVDWETYCSKNGKLLQIAMQALDTDNPVLIVYKFK